MNTLYYIRFYILLWFTNHFNKEKVNPIEKDGWVLIFHDEFQGNKLDEKRWTTNEHWGYIKHGVAWLKEQISIKNGICNLITDKYTGPNPVKDLDGKIKFIDNASGMLCSNPMLYRKYGYYEIRCKVPPKGIKYWPAFWFESKKSWPPEIDVFELMSPNSSKRMIMTYHWLDDKENKDQINALIIQCYTKKLIPYIPKTDINDVIQLLQIGWTQEKQEYIDNINKLRVHKKHHTGFSGYNWSKKYHTFAVNWEPKKITWYVDNIAVFRIKENQWVNFGKRIKLPEYPMYAIINNAAQPGYKFKSNDVPMSMPVNYFRVYEKE